MTMTSTTEEEEDFVYRCLSPQDETCARQCVGLEPCTECGCVVLELEARGPWGEAMDLIFCLFPILFLIVVTIKPNPMPTTRSLPMSAFLMFLVRLMYLGSDPILTCGSIILGLHEALTPISIMAGAITLFETMEATKCMPFMMREMKALTAGHPVAELMLIFNFAYMIEGASGFGTPVALGAPMLVSCGHDSLQAVVVLLIMNTFATVWGAVGTPIWFGFSGLTTEDGFLEVSYKSAVALCFGAFILIPMVLTIIVPWKTVRRNIVFIFASLATSVGPAIGIAFGSYEFPSLMGGLIGCVATAMLIRCNVGLAKLESEDLEEGRDPLEIGSVSEQSIVSSARSDLKVSSSRSELPTLTHKLSLDPIEEKQNEHSREMVDSEDGEEKKDEQAPELNGNDADAELEVPPDDSKTEDDDDKEESVLTRDSIKDDSLIKRNENNQQFSSVREAVDQELGPRLEYGQGYIKEVILRTFPIWAVVILLILTRVPAIGIKEYLTLREPSFSIYFGTYGTFRLSASLVMQLLDILTYPGLQWKYELLYLPFFMPFLFVSGCTLVLFRKDLSSGPKQIASTVAGRLVNPLFALMGALSLVQLLIKVDTVAPAFILGNILADWFKQAFIIICPLLGALGSFFSGSTTVSNLTFGSIQVIAAESIGTSETSMLALQAVGASAGNGICLNNIIAACAVVGLTIGEGQILMRTYKFVLASTTISTAVMLAFFFRFN